MPGSFRDFKSCSGAAVRWSPRAFKARRVERCVTRCEISELRNNSDCAHERLKSRIQHQGRKVAGCRIEARTAR